MAQGHCPGKFPLHTPARKSVVISYPASPTAEPTKGVVTPESSPVKSRLEGNRMLKPCALDDVSPFPPSTLGQEQVRSTQVTNTAHDAHPSIITSVALDFEEYLNLDKEKDRYKADPDRLKRDLAIIETMKQSFAEAKEATPVQQITSPRTISTEQERTALGLRQEELIRALPDWLLSDGNASYDLKKYLSHEVRSVHVDIIPDSGVLQFDTEEWVMSHKVSNLECHQFVITIRAYADKVEDHKIIFAYNDIDPLPSLESEYKGISLPLEQQLISRHRRSGIVFGKAIRIV